VVAGEGHVHVRDVVAGHAEPLRDHAGLVERQAGAGAVALDHVDPVGCPVPELGHDSRAFTHFGGGYAPADERVHKCRLSGFQAAGDGDPQRLVEASAHPKHLRLRRRTHPWADVVTECRHPGTERTWSHDSSAGGTVGDNGMVPAVVLAHRVGVPPAGSTL
jgi:hypothetical protein